MPHLLLLAPPDQVADSLERTLGELYLEHADADISSAIGKLRRASTCSDFNIADRAIFARVELAAALRI